MKELQAWEEKLSVNSVYRVEHVQSVTTILHRHGCVIFDCIALERTHFTRINMRHLGLVLSKVPQKLFGLRKLLLAQIYSRVAKV